MPNHFALVDVVNCPLANAYAVTGGWIKLCLPLVAGIESEDELAFVISHEMAHVLLDHVSRFRDPSFPVYSLPDEIDADALGLRMSVMAGYSPDASEIFLSKSLSQAQSLNQKAAASDLDLRWKRVYAQIQWHYQLLSDIKTFTE